MMGEAGRCALDNDILIPRITGLDPSGPLFQGLVKYPALDKASAYFVDVIHTDTGKYGSKTSMGTVDFYPNYKKTNAKQPGCPDGKFEQLSPEDRCSHDRAVLLFCEGTRNPHTLMAAGAKNFDDWQKQNGTTDDINYIGPLTDFTVSGNYYLTTNSESLYSKGEEGLKPPSQ
uniref:Lipase domain-containing protein n=1 Tax=Pectinophora gossypiella TaxID=13191 RepID=A0A1E1WJD1_PECGO